MHQVADMPSCSTRALLHFGTTAIIVQQTFSDLESYLIQGAQSDHLCLLADQSPIPFGCQHRLVYSVPLAAPLAAEDR